MHYKQHQHRYRRYDGVYIEDKAIEYRKSRIESWMQRQKEEKEADDDDDDINTLGVSVILYNHWPLHPSTVRSNPHLYRTSHQFNTTTSTSRPSQTSSDQSTNCDQRRPSAASCYTDCLSDEQPRQSSDAQDSHVHQCRLLPVLVAVRGRQSDTVFPQVVPAAVRRRVHRDVAC